jgi:3-dehydroquinate dehydratase II
MNIHIINGCNLNLLGKREVDIYGKTSFEEYFTQLQSLYPSLILTYYQSNIEGELVNEIQKVGFAYQGIILNAGAYSHTSLAIADAVAAITTPTIEVHISNIFAREEYRHHSYISAKAKGIISGLGLQGYKIAIDWFLMQHR